MILVTLDNLAQYKGLNPNLDAAIDFLAAFSAEGRADGRYDIRAGEVYYMLQSPALTPREECRYEAHEKYIDIQCALEDGEEIGWHNADALDFEEYDARRDVRFASAKPGETRLQMRKGMCAIFFPSDAHSPGRAQSAARIIRKLVVKVAVQEHL